jgi:aminoglycoside phosphotransferase (APT) family kinase protein
MSGDPWQALVDLGKLQTWMGRSRPWTRPENPGGTQNILLRFERDGRSYVLRRSARSPRGDGNATNRREARVLGALAGSDVRIPA